uniref:Battenin n=1 Tax=Strongyloides papillosus TaxID=174720 RepID=A0A0N5BSN4_STREA
MSWNDQKTIKWRNICSFWIFGLCNYYAFAIMLSAAESIMKNQKNHGSISKNLTASTCFSSVNSRECETISTGVVLIADIVPILLVKITFPFFINRIPFGIRHFIICICQVAGYLIVGLSTSTFMSLTGVVVASFGSGFGEITYLALTSYYDRDSISSWSSGCGAAGLVASFVFAALTEPHLGNLSSSETCLIMLVIPIIFGIAYFLILDTSNIYKINVTKFNTWIIPNNYIPENLKKNHVVFENKVMNFKEKIIAIVPLLKLMIPLCVVYFGEYLINQGITSLIIFDCKHSFYLSKESQYRWFQVTYQIGAFLSRSSIKLIKLPLWVIYLLPVFQILTLIFMLTEAFYYFIPHISIVFIITILEGLFGGSCYVNAFDYIHSNVPKEIREYSLTAASLGDSVGVCIAGFLAIPIHNTVCKSKFYKR